MILDEGLNQVKDLVNADLSKGQSGTGTTLPTAADTGLEVADTDTLLTLTSVTVNDKQLTTQHDINSIVANGVTLTEHEIQFVSGESFNRNVHAAISKTSAIEIQYLDTFYFER